ncbi:rhamnulokinase [Herbiconiux sp. SYSU D00978]|uniref:rhamnulokinase n=1 Tax=Herbiconiux sp. SYSU D00978 TaxID=2812562 RepID=UPI001A95BCCE|nr:rhamnulokinase family protein [Herbiconiux sp. SYSU D00978]
MTTTLAAVDLGATSGRVVLGHLDRADFRMHIAARFPNTPVRTPDGLHWNILELYRSVLAGLTGALREHEVASIGIDSWAVDYALVRGGRMLGVPFHYRDERTERGVELVHAKVGAEELYRESGLQHLPFNTVFQLAAEQADAGELDPRDRMLMIPDLLAYWLTGEQGVERTNASTTGLLSVTSGGWNSSLIELLGYPRELFPRLVDPGATIGTLLPSVATELGARSAIPVTAVGSHDTASAVVAVPAASADYAYISCGTWGLVGVELERPVVTDAGRAANFTNEGGVDGRIRYLHNVMGLWLLTESVREWERDGSEIHLPSLLEAAAAVTGEIPTFDANDTEFLAPGRMATRIVEHCCARGIRVSVDDRAFLARVIVESLAEAFARAVHQASELSGHPVSTVHIVGGGSQNALLCQAIADRVGLPVLAGPVEATAMGNLLVQARAVGALSGDLESLRAVVRSVVAPVAYAPRTLAQRG